MSSSWGYQAAKRFDANSGLASSSGRIFTIVLFGRLLVNSVFWAILLRRFGSKAFADGLSNFNCQCVATPRCKFHDYSTTIHVSSFPSSEPVVRSVLLRIPGMLCREYFGFRWVRSLLSFGLNKSSIRTACIYLAYASVQPQFKGVAVDRVTALLLHLRRTLLIENSIQSQS